MTISIVKINKFTYGSTIQPNLFIVFRSSTIIWLEEHIMTNCVKTAMAIVKKQ